MYTNSTDFYIVWMNRGEHVVISRNGLLEAVEAELLYTYLTLNR